MWDVRVGRFVYTQENTPSTGDFTAASRIDNATNVASGAPQAFSTVSIARTTAKATMSRYQAGWLGADHQWRIGGQVERGGHHATNVIPTGMRYVDVAGQAFRAISSAPSHAGAQFVNYSAFATDALTLGERVTINAGLRYDYTRAFSQDLSAVDLQGGETDAIVQGRGTHYTWNVLSPRAGLTARLTADGKTILRASFGRFTQGVLTGELEAFHPGASPITTADFDPATGGYTRIVSVVDNTANLRLDPNTRAPRTGRVLDRRRSGPRPEAGRRGRLRP